MGAHGRYPDSRLVAPDPAWPRRYAVLAAELGRALGPDWAFEHVGSTSVPGPVTPADRERYAELKTSLVAAGVWGERYTVAKAGFVHDIVNRARAADGLPPVSGPL